MNNNSKVILQQFGDPSTVTIDRDKCVIRTRQDNKLVDCCAIFNGPNGTAIRSYADGVLVNGEPSIVSWLSSGDEIQLPCSTKLKVKSAKPFHPSRTNKATIERSAASIPVEVNEAKQQTDAPNAVAVAESGEEEEVFLSSFSDDLATSESTEATVSASDAQSMLERLGAINGEPSYVNAEPEYQQQEAEHFVQPSQVAPADVELPSDDVLQSPESQFQPLETKATSPTDEQISTNMSTNEQTTMIQSQQDTPMQPEGSLSTSQDLASSGSHAAESAVDEAPQPNRQASVADILSKMGMHVPGSEEFDSPAQETFVNDSSVQPTQAQESPQPTMLEAESAPAPNVSPEVSAAGETDSEDDIQAYMDRLLNRKNADDVQAAMVAQQQEEAAAQSDTPAHQPVKVLSPEEFVPTHRASRHESFEDLREIANSCSRSAIRASTSKARTESVIVKASLFILAFAGALLSYQLGMTFPAFAFVAAAFATSYLFYQEYRKRESEQAATACSIKNAESAKA